MMCCVVRIAPNLRAILTSGRSVKNSFLACIVVVGVLFVSCFAAEFRSSLASRGKIGDPDVVICVSDGIGVRLLSARCPVEKPWKSGKKVDILLAGGDHRIGHGWVGSGWEIRVRWSSCGHMRVGHWFIPEPL